MDGKTLIRELRGILNEPSGTTYMTDRDSYGFLWDAAIATANRIFSPLSTQTIITTAGVAAYNLNPDFSQLYMRDINNLQTIRYTPVGLSAVDIEWEPYERLFYAKNTTAVAIPSNFTILESTAKSQITGTATATGSLSNGLSTLTDSTANFTVNVSPGDIVHDTNDGSDGIVVTVASPTQLQVALFEGTNNFFTNGDSYLISPQMSYRVILDPLPKNGGDSFQVNYVQRPNPVFSPYGFYNLPSQMKEAIVAYAGWKYKYRDREPSLGDPLYHIWDVKTREQGRRMNQVRQQPRLTVSFVKTALRDRSYR